MKPKNYTSLPQVLHPCHAKSMAITYENGYACMVLTFYCHNPVQHEHCPITTHIPTIECPQFRALAQVLLCILHISEHSHAAEQARTYT